MVESIFRSAFITGASAGIGAEYARQLAAQHTNLYLLARRKEKLEALAAQLRHEHSVNIEIVQLDLSKPEDVALAEVKIATISDLDLLVNNAGFGSTGHFYDPDPKQHYDMLQVHVNASVHLAHAALPGMVAHHQGYIVNVASVAAFYPFGSVLYPSTKAFLVSFTQSLQTELYGTGVHVQALCPGFTYTEFHDVTHMDRSIVPKFMWLSAETVVRTSLKALPRRSLIVVPGWQYRFFVLIARVPFIFTIAQRIAASRYYRRRITHDQHP